MSAINQPLAVKLGEMEKRLSSVRARIEQAQHMEPARLSLAMRQANAMCRQDMDTLEKTAAYAKSSLAASLAAAQMAYLEKTRGLLEKQGSDYAILAAEDAIDLAIYLADEALLVSLRALEPRDSPREKQN